MEEDFQVPQDDTEAWLNTPEPDEEANDAPPMESTDPLPDEPPVETPTDTQTEPTTQGAEKPADVLDQVMASLKEATPDAAPNDLEPGKFADDTGTPGSASKDVLGEVFKSLQEPQKDESGAISDPAELDKMVKGFKGDDQPWGITDHLAAAAKSVAHEADRYFGVPQMIMKGATTLASQFTGRDPEKSGLWGAANRLDEGGGLAALPGVGLPFQVAKLAHDFGISDTNVSQALTPTLEQQNSVVGMTAKGLTDLAPLIAATIGSGGLAAMGIFGAVGGLEGGTTHAEQARRAGAAQAEQSGQQPTDFSTPGAYAAGVGVGAVSNAAMPFFMKVFGVMEHVAPALYNRLAQNWISRGAVGAAESGAGFAGFGELMAYTDSFLAKQIYDPTAEYHWDSKRFLSSLATGALLGGGHKAMSEAPLPSPLDDPSQRPPPVPGAMPPPDPGVAAALQPPPPPAGPPPMMNRGTAPVAPKPVSTVADTGNQHQPSVRDHGNDGHLAKGALPDADKPWMTQKTPLTVVDPAQADPGLAAALGETKITVNGQDRPDLVAKVQQDVTAQRAAAQPPPAPALPPERMAQPGQQPTPTQGPQPFLGPARGYSQHAPVAPPEGFRPPAVGRAPAPQEFSGYGRAPEAPPPGFQPPAVARSAPLPPSGPQPFVGRTVPVPEPTPRAQNVPERFPAKLADVLERTRAPIDKVKAAAIEVPGGRLFEGGNHTLAFDQLAHDTSIPADARMRTGFTTQKGAFVNREQASAIADRAEQLQQGRHGDRSEDFKAEELDHAAATRPPRTQAAPVPQTQAEKFKAMAAAEVARARAAMPEKARQAVATAEPRPAEARKAADQEFGKALYEHKALMDDARTDPEARMDLEHSEDALIEKWNKANPDRKADSFEGMLEKFNERATSPEEASTIKRVERQEAAKAEASRKMEKANQEGAPTTAGRKQQAHVERQTHLAEQAYNKIEAADLFKDIGSLLHKSGVPWRAFNAKVKALLDSLGGGELRMNQRKAHPRFVEPLRPKAGGGFQKPQGAEATKRYSPVRFKYPKGHPEAGEYRESPRDFANRTWMHKALGDLELLDPDIKSKAISKAERQARAIEVADRFNTYRKFAEGKATDADVEKFMQMHAERVSAGDLSKKHQGADVAVESVVRPIEKMPEFSDHVKSLKTLISERREQLDRDTKFGDRISDGIGRYEEALDEHAANLRDGVELVWSRKLHDYVEAEPLAAPRDVKEELPWGHLATNSPVVKELYNAVMGALTHGVKVVRLDAKTFDALYPDKGMSYGRPEAQYNAAVDHIVLREGAGPVTLFHEAIHAAIMRRYYANEAKYAPLVDRLLAEIKAKTKFPDNDYAFSNVDELFAHMSDAQVRNEMGRIMLSKDLARDLGVYKIATLWDGAYQTMRKLLGLADRPAEKVSALEAMLRLSDNIMREEHPVKGEGRVAQAFAPPPERPAFGRKVEPEPETERRVEPRGPLRGGLREAMASEDELRASRPVRTPAEEARFEPVAESVRRVFNDLDKDIAGQITKGAKTPFMLTKRLMSGIVKDISEQLWPHSANERQENPFKRFATALHEQGARRDELMKPMDQIAMEIRRLSQLDPVAAEDFADTLYHATQSGNWGELPLNRQAYKPNSPEGWWKAAQHPTAEHNYNTYTPELRNLRDRILKATYERKRDIIEQQSNNFLTKTEDMYDKDLVRRVLTDTDTQQDRDAISVPMYEQLKSYSKLFDEKYPYVTLDREGKYRTAGTYRHVAPPASVAERVENAGNASIYRFHDETAAHDYDVQQIAEPTVTVRWVDTATGKTFSERDVVIDHGKGKYQVERRQYPFSAQDAAVNPDIQKRWDVKLNNEYLRFHRTEADAREHAQAMSDTGLFAWEGGVEPHAYREELNEVSGYKVGAEIDSVLSNDPKYAGLSPEQKASVRSAMLQLSIQRMASTSTVNRALRRTNTQGFDTDLERSIYSYNRSSSAALARSEIGPRIDKTLEEMDALKNEFPNSKTAIVNMTNELKRRRADSEDVGGDGSWSRAARRSLALSAMYRLMTPTFGGQQIAQHVTHSIPFMAEKHGAEGVAELERVMMKMHTGSMLWQGVTNTARAVAGRDVQTANIDRLKQTFANEPGVPEFIDWAIKTKMVEPDMGLQMEELSQRPNNYDVGPRTARILNTTVNGIDHAIRYLQAIARAFPQAAEQQLRLNQGIAAYNMGIKKGMSVMEAREAASEMVDTSQTRYTRENAPPMANTGVGQLAFQFKKFQAQQYENLLGRIATMTRDVPREEKTAAARGLAMWLGNAAIIGGINAMPIMEIGNAIGIVSRFFGGPDWDDVQRVARATLADGLQKLGMSQGSARNLAAVGWKGLPYYLGVDLSGKLGYGGGLLFGSPQATNNDKDWDTNFIAWAAQLVFGAPLGMGINMAHGIQQILKGDVAKGLAEMVPVKAFGDTVKAVQGYTAGKHTDRGIQQQRPYTAVEAIGKAAGLPQRVDAETGAARAAVAAANRQTTAAHSKLITNYINARNGDDSAAYSKAFQQAIDGGMKAGDLQKAYTRWKNQSKQQENGVTFTNKKQREDVRRLTSPYWTD